MNKIVNLTQHAATPAQIAAGVFELNPKLKAELITALTVVDLPTNEQILERATLIAYLGMNSVQDENGDAIFGGEAMIGGAPWMMAELETQLREVGLTPVYAFSKRKALERTNPVTGAVEKTSEFVHEGFIRPDAPWPEVKPYSEDGYVRPD